MLQFKSVNGLLAFCKKKRFRKNLVLELWSKNLKTNRDVRLFKLQFQLSFVCQTNLKSVNLLDVTLDLTTHKYNPYNKPSNLPLYINVKPHKPPNIIKNLPENMSRCIYKLLSDKSVFDISKDLYNSEHSSSGFKYKAKFNPDLNKNISRKKNRKRKVIWFNPPYCSNVSINIGERFLTILDRPFPKSHELYKIFTRNNVKISYSSLPNFPPITYTIKSLSTTKSQKHLLLLVIVVQKHLVL